MLSKSKTKRTLLLRLEPVSERKKRLTGFDAFLQKNRDRIAEAVLMISKNRKQNLMFPELYPVLTEIRHALNTLDEWAAPQKIEAPLPYLGTRSEVRYDLKAFAIIAPWEFSNQPLFWSADFVFGCRQYCDYKAFRVDATYFTIDFRLSDRIVCSRFGTSYRRRTKCC